MPEIPQIYRPILDKLQSLATRHAEVEHQLNNPDTAAKPAEVVALAKEHGRLSRTLASYQHFTRAQKEFAEAHTLASDPAQDTDMRELAAAELPALQTTRD